MNRCECEFDLELDEPSGCIAVSVGSYEGMQVERLGREDRLTVDTRGSIVSSYMLCHGESPIYHVATGTRTLAGHEQ